MSSPLLREIPRRRFLVSAWPWRGLAYAASTAVVSGVLWGFLSCPVGLLLVSVTHSRSSGASLLTALPGWLVGVGLLLGGGPPLAVGLGALERRRLRMVDERPTRAGRSGNLYLDPATWRAFAYLLVLAVVAPLWIGALGLVSLFTVTLLITPLAAGTSVGPFVVGPYTVDSAPGVWVLFLLGIVLLPGLPYLTAGLAGGHAALARALLSVEPDPAAAELVEVARSRARLVDAFDAERHRIERDLHDGAQQRLVSLTMQLGLARLDLPAQAPAAAAVESAHEQAKALMVELRNLIHGINPRTLSELGLAAALDELAAGGPVPVSVRAEPGTLPPAVATVAYFSVAEALSNVAKHSGATGATVTASRVGPVLVVEVRDDGRGGADPARGSGLTGLSDRVASAGGRLLLSSPAGGPTVVRIELPCGS